MIVLDREESMEEEVPEEAGGIIYILERLLLTGSEKNALGRHGLVLGVAWVDTMTHTE